MSALSTVQEQLKRVYRFYGRLTRQQEDARLSQIVDVLKQVPLFQGFSYTARQDLAAMLHTRVYKRDEFLYYERDPGLGLYIVEQGRIRLLMEDEEGGVHELQQLRPYGFFGELSLLGDFRRIETAQAVVETQVLGLFRPDLTTLIKRNPRVGAAVLVALSRHVGMQHADLMQQFVERDGKQALVQIFTGAALRPSLYDPDTPVTP